MLTDRQSEIIIGTMLGDGAMRCKKNALLEVNHCAAQQSYVDWKYRELANLVATPPRLRTGNGARVAYRFTTLSLETLTPIYRSLYVGRRKVIPHELVVTPLALAVWFMDDGSRSRSSVYLNTQQFSPDDQQRLIGILKNQHGLGSSLNRDKAYFRIRIAIGSMPQFVSLVRRHMIPEMLYKLPTPHRCH